MSISAILLGYHTGLPITHAGNVMQRISLHVPLGKGTKRSVWKSRSLRSTHENCLVDPWSDHALFKLPGTSSCMVRGDPLHILLCKGLYSHLMGGILHYLCYYEGPGVRTTKNPLKGYQCCSHKSRFIIQSSNAKTG